MNLLGKIGLGAVGIVAGAVMAAGRKGLRQDMEALGRRVGELEARSGDAPTLAPILEAHAQRLANLETGSQRQSEGLQDLQASVNRMEQGFNLLGERLNTQIEILETLQASYSDKEQRLQTALHAVIEAVNEIRRTRVPAGVGV